MTDDTKSKGRGEGKLTPKKLARDMKRSMEGLLDQDPTVDDLEKLLEIGFHTSTSFLINCVLGDPSIDGLSATNRVSAAKEVRDMALSLIGKNKLLELEEESEEEQERLSQEQEDSLGIEDSSNVVGFIGKHQG